MAVEELIKEHQYKLVSAIVLLIVSLFGVNTITSDTDLTPGAIRLNQHDVPGTFSQTSTSNDTFYEILDATAFTGEKWAVKKFTILVKVHSTKTPADYDDTVCGLYWDEVYVGNVSQFNNWVVEIESDDWATTNLTFKCSNLGNDGSDTVKIDYIYRWQ